MAKKLGLRLLAATAALGIGWTSLGGEGGVERPLAAPPAAIGAAHAAAGSGGEGGEGAAASAAHAAAGSGGEGGEGAASAVRAGGSGAEAQAAGARSTRAAMAAGIGSAQPDSEAASAAALDSPQPEIGGAELLEALRQAASRASSTGAAPAAGQPGAVAAKAKPAAAAKTVYLTFDDGPSEHTAQVLDILREQGIKATFFMVGRQVKAHPELVQRTREEGHAIGNHSYDHDYNQLYGSFQGYARQTLLTEQALLDAGVATTLVRAPGGTYTNFDEGYFRAMREAGYTMADWNVDSGDSKRIGVPAAEIAAGATSAALKREMTVLLHDGTGHGESVKALPAIIAFYRAHGYAFAALDGGGEAPVFPVAAKLKWKREAPKAEEIAALAERSRELRRSPEWLAAAADSVPAWNGSAAQAGKTAEADSKAGAKASAKVGVEAEAGAKAGTEAEAKAGAKAGAEAEAKAGAKAGAEADAKVNAEAEGKASAVANGSASAKTYGTQLADLRLHGATGETTIVYGEYRIVEGELYVPVRRTADALGGRVEWDGARRTATVFATTGEAAALDPETAFRDSAGVLYAPLEELLRLLGDPLQKLEKTPGKVDGWLRSAVDAGGSSRSGADGELAGPNAETAPAAGEPAAADKA
ncbi:polysaccharide deacetylase [Paenibacillus sp. B01]|uniref:polysaccharide deacetylase n=1 Tax=Paenibacillus sp. B01 TaxID=2660554 RepID=UPI00129BC601|nr:polysaccharide deacetylase [Paenibacillus sp. B01]QGG57910.1 polysaccharide deacetylase family protein [Paenibacillus sp. B01]